MQSIKYLNILLILLFSCKENKVSDLPVQWYSGYAEAKITPPLGTLMVEPQNKKATGIHDDLYLRVVTFSDGTDTVALATYDLVGMDLPMAEYLQQAIAEANSLSTEAVMLSSTHTHNAPVTIKLGKGRQRNLQWENRLKQQSIAAVAAALQNLEPVDLAFSKAPVQVAFNRRLMMFNRARMQPNPHGPVAKEVSVLSIKSGNDKQQIIFNYPAHPVALHSASAWFSADFPGLAIKSIEDSLGGDVEAIFAQGCAGDINVEPLKGGYQAAEDVGNKLGNAVIAALSNSQNVNDGRLRFQSQTIYLPYRQIAPEIANRLELRVQEAIETLADNEADEITMQDQQDVLNWTRVVQHVANNPDSIAGLPMQVQLFSFGNELAILAFSHELFVEYQKFFQENSPFEHTMVLAYTNGSASYIPTAEAFYLNGYEIHGAQHRYAQPYLTPKVEDLIKETGMAMLRELHETN